MSVPWIPFRASAQVDTWEFSNYLLFLGEVGLPALPWLPQNVKAETSHIHPHPLRKWWPFCCPQMVMVL